MKNTPTAVHDTTYAIPNDDKLDDPTVIYLNVEAIPDTASAGPPLNHHIPGVDHAHGAGLF